MPNSLRYQQSSAVVPHSFKVAAPTQNSAEDVELSNYLDILYEQRWFIFGIAMLVLLAGLGYAFLAKPVYEANVLIHVEEESSKESRNLLSESGSMFSTKTSASAEIELFQSRLVLSRAIDKLNLDIWGGPHYLPVIGKWLAPYLENFQAPAWVQEHGYAWGGEKIRVDSFTVPDELINKEFDLTLENDGRFSITEAVSGFAASGHVGQPLVVDSPSGRIELLVQSVTARPGTKFKVIRLSRERLIKNILKHMRVTEQGKQSGIIRASLQGDNAEDVSQVLGEIAKAYITQNAARKTQEVDNALAFLQKRLPEAKAELNLAESRYAQFRNEHGTVDLGEDGKLSLQQSAALKTRKIELQQKRNDLLTRYTPEHPFVQSIDAQIVDANRELRTLAGHIKALPLMEQELVTLSRDVKVNTELYTALLNTTRQLQLTTVAKTSNVRLVDMPLTPDMPVSPKRMVIGGASLLAGLILGAVGAFIRKSLQKTIDDPTEIEQMQGIPVYAAIPHSKTQLDLLSEADAKSGQWPLLARAAPNDIAVESLRTFRTVLQYTMSGLRGKVLLMTGPTPGTGKSFVSANLAALLSAAGKRVLLIDGDLRNGRLHEYFGLRCRSGLSELIAGHERADSVIHRELLPNLDFLATGALPEDASELLMRPSLGALLEAFETRYDIILIDSAPLLAVSDSVILGMHAARIYLLARAGLTRTSEIEESVKRLNQAGLTANGFLLNDVPLRNRQYGYGYPYGQYRWRQYSERRLPTN